ncbi:10948_t:CDS:2 [Paraglomus brasilianum]|uniref:10948_t:CDS:1 n=1 Tax=Paraglomus brasilianum TaxID=144538 RepID=A0A9N9GB06_9GLOM|nr:10948_t:CDS:2 [Paraglomus brasilianum]
MRLCTQRWRHWKNKPPTEYFGWKDVYSTRHRTDRNVLDLLQNLLEQSSGHLRLMAEISTFESDCIDILMLIVKSNLWDYSLRFYAKRCLQLVRKRYILGQWDALKQGTIDFPIWKGFAMLAMFRSPSIELEDIDFKFNSLASEFIQQISPNNETLSDEDKCKALVDFFCRQKDFRGNVERYYNPSNSLIDKVFETRRGIPISLAIIFHELCMRVNVNGVSLFPTPQHYLLHFTSPTTDADFFIDLFNNGKIMSRTEVSQMLSMSFGLLFINFDLRPPYPLEVYARVLHNIINGFRRTQNDHEVLYSALFQLLVIHPHEPVEIYNLWLELLKHMWPEDAVVAGSLNFVGFHRPELLRNDLQEIREEYDKGSDRVMRRKRHNVGEGEEDIGDRKGGPVFEIGMVFFHKRFRYTGVIYGYDEECVAEEDWILRMHVDDLERGRYQPFYNCLCDDGSPRYVAEENIQTMFEPKPIPPEVWEDIDRKRFDLDCDRDFWREQNEGFPEGNQPMNFDAIGRFFVNWSKEFERYLPNKRLRQEYPDY